MTASVPIWFDDLAVGRVDVAADGSLSLRYADRWLQTTGAFPLSVTMPLRADPYPSDVISPWLANLLPEEEQLQVLTRSLGLDQADVLGVLAEIGGDIAGALSFGVATDRALWAYTPLTSFYDTADPRLALERHFEDLGRRPFLVGEEGVRQSLAGGQKKSALAVLGPDGAPVLRLPQEGDVLAIPVNGAPSTLIVKPDNPNLPGITETKSGACAWHRPSASRRRRRRSSSRRSGPQPVCCAMIGGSGGVVSSCVFIKKTLPRPMVYHLAGNTSAVHCRGLTSRPFSRPAATSAPVMHWLS